MLRRAPSRLSRIWVPTGGIASSGVEDGHSKLIRAGFLRQTYPGMFNMLPLGRRVQEKTEMLVERHMEESLGTLIFASRSMERPLPTNHIFIL